MSKQTEDSAKSPTLELINYYSPIIIVDSEESDINDEHYENNENVGSEHSDNNEGTEEKDQTATDRNEHILTEALGETSDEYYTQITEDCVGLDESKRMLALKLLATSEKLQEVVDRISIFIMEEVKLNVIKKNLMSLTFLMEMAKSLVENPNISVHKHLPELVHSVSLCIITEDLCQDPNTDDHWSLRDTSAKLMAHLCKHFNTTTNNIHSRMLRLYTDGVLNKKSNENRLYGSIVGLTELGECAIEKGIIPKIRMISNRITFEFYSKNAGVAKRNAGNRIANAIVKCCAPVVKMNMPPESETFDYKLSFGFLGNSIRNEILKMARDAPDVNPLKRKRSSSSSNISLDINDGAQVEQPQQKVLKKDNADAQSAGNQSASTIDMPQNDNAGETSQEVRTRFS